MLGQSAKVQKTTKLSLVEFEVFFGMSSEMESKYHLNVLLPVQASNAYSQLISASLSGKLPTYCKPQRGCQRKSYLAKVFRTPHRGSRYLIDDDCLLPR